MRKKSARDENLLESGIGAADRTFASHFGGAFLAHRKM